MNWFGPSGHCGCCDDTPECTDHVCGSYVHADGYTVRTIDGTDLAACQCFDFDAQVIRSYNRSYNVNLYGIATGNAFFIGGSFYTPANVDISGTYSFSETNTPFGTYNEFCVTVASPSLYLLYSEFLVTHSGQDYYAQIYLYPRGLGAELVSGVSVVFTGNPAPTGGLSGQGESWSYDWTDTPPCSGNCFCGEFLISRLKNYLTPGTGHDLSGITGDGAQT